jgi:hypothetical protein
MGDCGKYCRWFAIEEELSLLNFGSPVYMFALVLIFVCQNGVALPHSVKNQFDIPRNKN